MITVDLPRCPADADFLVDCACDYAEEALRETGLLNNGSLLSEDMLTLVIKKGDRSIGAVSSVTGVNDQGTRRTEIDVRYFAPRWRGKGYTRPLLEALLEISPTPLHLREVQDGEEDTARELGISFSEEESIDMRMITGMVMNSIECEHQPPAAPGTTEMMKPCDTCIRTTLREHFTEQCGRMIAKAHTYQASIPG